MLILHWRTVNNSEKGFVSCYWFWFLRMMAGTDRRSVLVNMRTHIPERLLQIDAKTRTVLATNKTKKLKVYLYFTEPVVNSSIEILNSLKTSQGSLTPIDGKSLGKRRFGFEVIFFISLLYLLEYYKICCVLLVFHRFS